MSVCPGCHAALVVAGLAAHLWISPAREAAAQSIPPSPAAQAAGAQITYSYGIEFVTVGSVGNPSYPAADWNADSSVNPDDLGDFINAYFLTCWL